MGQFILVKHDAIKRGLHYDLRFQIPNSSNWASFVLRDLPPTEPGKRVYVPRSNDHSSSEATFVGKIPEGEYGAGKLTRIDGGSCTVEKYSNAHIVVDFKGSKISGIYHFINMGVAGSKKDYKSKVYAFFKGKIKK